MTYSQQHIPRPQRDVWHTFFAYIRDSYIVRTDNRIIAGVCGGFARRLGISVALVRVLLAVSVLFAGFGFVIYGLGWLLLPDEVTGRILLQDVLNGEWTAEIIVPTIIAALAILIPIAGWFAAFVAVIVMYIVISQCERQARLQSQYTHNAGTQTNSNTYPYAAGVPNNMPNTAQAQQEQSAYVYTAQSDSAAPASSASAASQTAYMASAGQTAQQSTQSAQTAPSAQTPYTASACSTPESTGHHASDSASNYTSPHYTAPQYGAQHTVPGYNTSTSNYSANYAAPQYATAPVAQPVVMRARRTPAGPAVVLCMIGVIVLAVAVSVLLGIAITNGTLQWHVWDVAAIASGVVCLIMGTTIVVLGIRGRRSGGLIPLALIVGFATCINMSVAGIQNFEVADMLNSYHYASVAMVGPSHSGSVSSLGTVSEYGTLTVTPARADSDVISKLQQGVLFVGDHVSDSKVILDLTHIGEPHQIQLQNGKIVTSKCPVGQYNINVVNAYVTLRLPYGCSYGFGEDGFYTASSLVSSRESYAVDNNSGIIGWAFGGLDGDYAIDSSQSTGDSSIDFVLPQDKPELLVNVKRAYNATVNYEYTDAHSDITSGYEYERSTDDAQSRVSGRIDDSQEPGSLDADSGSDLDE